jgi:hypothetical protein
MKNTADSRQRANYCRHCHANPLDQEQPESGLCAEDLDAAVWDAPCAYCGRVPTGRPSDHCEE